MKTIKSNKYANIWGDRDPYSVDFTHEEEQAKSKETNELLNSLKDAIEASKVSPNAGKYTDQASVYRRELENRGIGFGQQDRLIAQLPSLHSNPQPSHSMAYTITHKKAQIDIATCSVCGKTKSRDMMANSEVCYDCEDKRQIDNGQ